jgi:hypothetical protein
MKKLILILTVCFSLISCGKEIEINRSFDFELIALPFRTEATFGVPTEIRLEIRPIGGQYSGAKYFARYFLFSGEGLLTDEENRAFFSNDVYEIPDKVFRLYYTPNSGTSHEVEVVFFDNFGHQRVLMTTFTVPIIGTE